MPAVVETFRDILLLRRGPQDLPYSHQLLITLVVASILVQAVVSTNSTSAGVGESLLSSVLEVALILAALRVALQARGMGNRFIQAASGLLGCNLVFALVSLPITIAFGKITTDAGHIVPEQITSTQVALYPLILVLGIWQLAVNAHVLRHSLNLTFFGGIAVILGWIVLFTLLIAMTLAPQGS